jgi:predicted outer membrane repeat protein
MFNFRHIKICRPSALYKATIGGAAIVFAMLVSGGNLNAKTLYVNAKAAPGGKGTSWSSAYKFLRDALDHSGNGDQIFVAKGTYYPDDGASGLFGSRKMSFELKGQKVYGGFAGNETSLAQRNVAANTSVLSGAIWSGDNASDFWSLHVVVANQNSTLDGFIVEDGHANGGHSWNYPNVTEFDRGGGCYVEAGKILTLANCTFRDNRALADGGAIYVQGDSGKVIASNCVFQNNEIRLDYNITTGNSSGGAIKGNVDATNCKFISNIVNTQNFYEGTVSTAFGGAIAGNVRAVNCEFIGNKLYADGEDGLEPTADGGAIFGDFTGSGCVFTGNEAFDSKNQGISSGGAISGMVVKAFNCAFSANRSGTGIAKPEEVTNGGGGAIYTGNGKSTLANCVFVGNTSAFRGGAVQGGLNRETDSISISNCTFLNNGVTTGLEGSALSCGGIVSSLNNILWFTDPPVLSGFSRDKLIHVGFKGAFRNSSDEYPAPSSAAANLIKGGQSAITLGVIADLFLVSPSLLFVNADPMFVNLADPDGADNQWGTLDDGLRLSGGSPALGKSLDPRTPDYVDVRPKDLADSDRDGDLAEKLPVDMLGNVRVQNGFIEIGAYESGNLANVPEIAVFDGNASLTDGVTRSFGKVVKRKSKEMTFTIRSVGTNRLAGISVALEDQKEFTLKKATYNFLDPGSSATVTVIFKPRSTGKFTAKLTILSSDANESPFDITLTGNGVKPPSRKKKSSVIEAADFARHITAESSSSNNTITGTITSNDGKHLVLTVLKTAGVTPGTVEVSPDLVNWYSGPVHTTILQDNSTLIKVRDNTPVPDGGKRFIRIR